MKRSTLRYAADCWLAPLALDGTAPALAQPGPRTSAYNSGVSQISLSVGGTIEVE